MKLSKLLIVFFSLLFVAIIYYRPFIFGHEAQIIDRYIKLSDQTPLFVVYSPQLTAGENILNTFKKTGMRIFRIYNISHFELLLSPIKQSRGLFIAKVKMACTGGMCWSYDFEQVPSLLSDNDMQAVKEYLDSSSDPFDAGSFYSFSKRRLGEYEANRIDSSLKTSRLEYQELENQFKHVPLETFFLAPKTSAESQ